MSAGYSQLAFGGWPHSAPVYPANPNPEILYVDPVNGKDFNNPSGAQARPLRTLEELSKRLVGFTNAVDVHLRGATYPLPPGGVFLQSRMLNGRIRIFADEVWDPGVFIVPLDESDNPISGVLDAGTTSAVLVTTNAIGVDSIVGYTVEVTHAGVVQRRLVRNNPVGGTDIVPDREFDAADPGDTFRVFRNAATIAAPSPLAPTDSYVFAADCPSYPPFDSEVDGGTERSPGLELQGVALDLTNGGDFFGMYFGRLPVWMYGVSLAGTLGVISCRGTQLQLGTGFASVRPQHEGWGLGVLAPLVGFFAMDSSLSGYIASVGDFGTLDRSKLTLLGGRFTRVFGGIVSGQLVCPSSTQAVPVLFDARGGGSDAIVTDRPDSVVELVNAEVHGGGGGISIEGGGTLLLDAAVTGDTAAGPAVHVGYGQGRVLLTGGVPQFGGAVATDYVVDGAAAPQNKSFFAAVGDSILGLKDSSTIVRVS